MLLNEDSFVSVAKQQGSAMTAKTKHAAGILLITQDPSQTVPQQFLLMRHTDRWDLPKGHCQAGETPMQTALRETEEETGISASSIEMLSDFSFMLEYPVVYAKPKSVAFTKRVTYFLGRLPAAVKVVCSEHPDYAWFDWLPPHQIQTQTIDPLLAAVQEYFAKSQLNVPSPSRPIAP